MYLKGKFYKKKESFSEALAVYRDVLLKEPHKLPVLQNAAQIHYLRGDYDEAKEVITQILVLQRTPDALQLLGDINLIQNNHELAKKNYNEALERLDPDKFDHDIQKGILEDKLRGL